MHFNVFSSFLKGALHDFEGKHAYIYSLYYSHRFLQQFCEIIVNSSNWLLHFNIFNQCFCWRFLRSKLLINWSTLLGLAGRWLRRQWLCWIPGLVDSMRIVTFQHFTCQRFSLSNFPAGTWRVGRGWCWSNSEFHGLRSSQIAFKIALQRVYFRFQTFGTWEHHALSKDKR